MCAGFAADGESNFCIRNVDTRKLCWSEISEKAIAVPPIEVGLASDA